MERVCDPTWVNSSDRVAIHTMAYIYEPYRKSMKSREIVKIGAIQTID